MTATVIIAPPEKAVERTLAWTDAERAELGDLIAAGYRQLGDPVHGHDMWSRCAAVADVDEVA